MINIYKYSPKNGQFNKILTRAETSDKEVYSTVLEIVNNVRRNKDKALSAYSEKFDNLPLTPENIKATPDEIEAALKNVGSEFIEIIKEARDNIKNFHQHQKRPSYTHNDGDGVMLSKRTLPIENVGVYCPAGSAPLFSSMLMNVVPAQVAGVKNITAVSPPQKDGSISPHILATASVLGIETIYRLGSAWAIAALAYGTESVKRVDKIVGPGNIFVATAKKIVFGQVGIDMVAGPSEVVVICDETANAEYVAADMLSQVEHGTGLESGVVLTTSADMADKIKAEVIKQTNSLQRSDTIQKSLSNYGGIFIVDSLEEAVRTSNLLAPEHLEIQCKNADELAMSVKNAGAIFIGEYSSEPVGDYFCGTNHVLPTGGAARFSSSLSVYDFLKDISMINYSKERLKKSGNKIISMAETEGLSAHANAIKVRMKDI
jgi:histidinol dehydrogenase